jgi:peptide/nickel transport system ATP-binding protein
MPPDLRALPGGCSFAPRCPHAEPAHSEAMPPEVADAKGHMARCFKVQLRNDNLHFSPGDAPAPTI